MTHELDNEDRAEFARSAMDVFQRETGSDEEDEFRDLVGNYAHLVYQDMPGPHTGRNVDAVLEHMRHEFDIGLEHFVAEVSCPACRGSSGDHTTCR